MKQVPRSIVILLTIIYLISLFFQMNALATHISGEATANVSLVVVAPNNPPYLNSSYPNLTWYRYSAYVGPSLNPPYFVDPDGDHLTYTVTGNVNIMITINYTDGVPTFTPAGDWWGIEYVTFNATDPGNLSAISNIVMLNVTYRDPPPPPQSEARGSAGRYSPRCIEKWICTDWSECEDGKQFRKCRELNKCGTNYSKPDEEQECHIPTCDDGEKNCHDGKCEEDVDCGGPCPPCGTCTDKLKNCHDGKCEEDVDCGGPCLPCVLTDVKQVVFERAPWIILLILLIAVFFIEGYIYYIKHYKLYRGFKIYRPRLLYKGVKRESERRKEERKEKIKGRRST